MHASIVSVISSVNTLEYIIQQIFSRNWSVGWSTSDTDLSMLILYVEAHDILDIESRWLQLAQF